VKQTIYRKDINKEWALFYEFVFSQRQIALYTFSFAGDSGSSVVKVLCYKSEGR